MKKTAFLKMFSLIFSLFTILSLCSCSLISNFFNDNTTVSKTEDLSRRVQITIHDGIENRIKIIKATETLNLDDYIPDESLGEFKGWYYDENFTLKVEDKIINVDTPYLEFYAYLIPYEIVDVTLHLANNEIHRAEVIKNKTFNLAPYEKDYEGMLFKGWYKDKELTEAAFVKEEFVASESIELYAKYEILTKYSLEIHVRDEVIKEDFYGVHTINIKEYVEPLDDEILTGWYTDSEYKNRIVDEFELKANIILYVECYKKEPIEYTVYLNKEPVKREALRFDYIDLTKEEVEIDNYRFVGWFYDSNYCEEIENPEHLKIGDKLEFYAFYKEMDKSTFYVSSLGSNGVLEKRLLGEFYHHKSIDLSTLKYTENERLELEGVYLDSECTTKLDIENKEYSCKYLISNTNNCTLYAKFNAPVEIYLGDECVSTEKHLLGTVINPKSYVDENNEDYLYMGTNTPEGDFEIYDATEIRINVFWYRPYQQKTTFEYTENNNSIQINKYTGSSLIVEIPSIINGKPVTKILSSAFDSDIVPRKITIPSSVIEIDVDTFKQDEIYEIYNLSKAQIKYSNFTKPNNLIEYTSTSTPSNIFIYKDEFIMIRRDGMLSMIGYVGTKPKLTLPSNIEGEIYQVGELSSKYINELIVPEGITYMNICNMRNLIKLTIPSTLISFGNKCLNNCYRVKEIYNLSNLKIRVEAAEIVFHTKLSEEEKIKLETYFEETMIDNVIHKIGVVSYIDEYSYYCLAGYNNSIYDYDFETLPSKINNSFYKIGNYMFYKNNWLLKEINSEGVSRIGTKAFQYSTTLNKLYLPNVADMFDYAFANSSIKDIYCPELVETATSIFESSNIETFTANKLRYVAQYMFSNCSSLTYVSMTNATTIFHNAFSCCKNLEVVDIPQVMNIYDSAFMNCYKLQIDSLPELVNIGHSAFRECDSIVEMHLPKLESIGTKTFSDCDNLTTIYAPSTIQKVYDTFENCPNFIGITTD